MKTLKNLTGKEVFFGIIIVFLFFSNFFMGLMAAIVFALYKKQYMGKKLRLFVSIVLLFIGSMGAIISSLPDDEPTTAAPTVESSKAAQPTTAAPKEEKAAPKEEAPKEAPKPVNIIQSIPEADAIQHIKDQAKIDWATDFEEQKYIIGEQTKAYNQLKALVIDTPEKEMILNQAHNDWGYDFEETLYIYNEQLKAYNELNK